MIGPTFVDTSVILDVFSRDPVWSTWSERMIATCAEHGRLVINAVVVAELSARFHEIEGLLAALDGYDIQTVPFDAAFLAGRAHAAYRARGGLRAAILPDFLIGAHAAVKGYALLTRDSKRVSYGFPTLRIIAPDGMP